MIIGDKYKQNPFEKGTLFLFCGRRSDRIKGLLLNWAIDLFLLYERIESWFVILAKNHGRAGVY